MLGEVRERRAIHTLSKINEETPRGEGGSRVKVVPQVVVRVSGVSEEGVEKDSSSNTFPRFSFLDRLVALHLPHLLRRSTLRMHRPCPLSQTTMDCTMVSLHLIDIIQPRRLEVQLVRVVPEPLLAIQVHTSRFLRASRIRNKVRNWTNSEIRLTKKLVLGSLSVKPNSRPRFLLVATLHRSHPLFILLSPTLRLPFLFPLLLLTAIPLLHP